MKVRLGKLLARLGIVLVLLVGGISLPYIYSPQILPSDRRRNQDHWPQTTGPDLPRHIWGAADLRLFKARRTPYLIFFNPRTLAVFSWSAPTVGFFIRACLTLNCKASIRS